MRSRVPVSEMREIHHAAQMIISQIDIGADSTAHRALVTV